MTNLIKTCIILLTGMLIICDTVRAQDTKKVEVQDTAYARTIRQRAAKIVTALAIDDTAKFRRVCDILAKQYSDLNDIHTTKDTQIKALKQSGQDKTVTEPQIKNLENEAWAKLYVLHFEFISRLLVELTPEQIEQVKDGMTYGKVAFTYNGYIAMMPSLTEIQKKQIMAWLVEARERAMDAGSSEKKTEIFGKYKGRIANYLSAQGYDLKKERAEWDKRIKAEENK
jgi:hypothetical protein